jgi:hypothetical protein
MFLATLQVVKECTGSVYHTVESFIHSLIFPFELKRTTELKGVRNDKGTQLYLPIDEHYPNGISRGHPIQKESLPSCSEHSTTKQNGRYLVPIFNACN